MHIRPYAETDQAMWDAYVHNHNDATYCHLSQWKQVIEQSYGHKAHYLMAINEDGQMAGLLPLVHLKSLLFGNSLVSMPYLDMGGILADNPEAFQALLNEAQEIGKQLRADHIELRYNKPTPWLFPNSSAPDPSNSTNPTNPINLSSSLTPKVRMLLDLPESAEALMKSFKAKLRSQIRKPIKDGLKAKIGGIELLDDFYKVFSVNMRDLGSPVHSKKLIAIVLSRFSEKARVVAVYLDTRPIAASIIFGFKSVLQNPWASSLREYSRLSPNMLLYWTMIEYAFDNGFTTFDFGRSSPEEGTYRFKKQWDSNEAPLYWHSLQLRAAALDDQPNQKSKFKKAIDYWKKLPLPVANFLGPRIRKYISL